MPRLPEFGVIGPGQLNEHGVGTGLEPFDEFLEVVEFHCRATGGAIVLGAADVEKDRVARIGNGIGVVMFDEDEPLVGGIAEVHVLLVPPLGERGAGRQGVEMVVFELSKLGIVDPGIAIGDLMVRPAFRTLGQLRSITHGEPDLEKTHGILAIAGLFLRAGLLRVETAAPCETTPAEHHGPGFAVGDPLAGGVAMKELQGALGRGEIVREADDHLFRGEAQGVFRGRRSRLEKAERPCDKKECQQPVHLS